MHSILSQNKILKLKIKIKTDSGILRHYLKLKRKNIPRN